MSVGVYKKSEEHKKKLSKAMMGKRNSPRTEFKKGNVGYWLGKHHSKETKRKIRETHKRIGTKPPSQKGKHPSEETRKRMSESNKGKHPKNFYQKLGTMSVIKQQNSKEPTSIEKKVYDELKTRGLLFETQKLINGKFVVDAYIPSLNLVVEADGNYWHSLSKNIKRDKTKNAYLKKCGFNLLRLTETEINDGSFKNKFRIWEHGSR